MNFIKIIDKNQKEYSDVFTFVNRSYMKYYGTKSLEPDTFIAAFNKNSDIIATVGLHLSESKCTEIDLFSALLPAKHPKYNKMKKKLIQFKNDKQAAVMGSVSFEKSIFSGPFLLFVSVFYLHKLGKVHALGMVGKDLEKHLTFIHCPILFLYQVVPSSLQTQITEKLGTYLLSKERKIFYFNIKQAAKKMGKNNISIARLCKKFDFDAASLGLDIISFEQLSEH